MLDSLTSEFSSLIPPEGQPGGGQGQGQDEVQGQARGAAEDRVVPVPARWAGVDG